ncbi:g3881 [Coccomyxa elongata]
MDSFHRQESEVLDGAAQLLVTLASGGRTEEPAANSSQVPPPSKETVGQENSQAPCLPMPPRNPSVLTKACQIWQHLRACAEKGFENVPESLLRTTFKNTADTSKAVRKLKDDGLVQRSGLGGKGSPFLYKVAPASLTTAHYATLPVEKRAGGRRRKAPVVTRRAAGRQPAPARGVPRAPDLAAGHGASVAPISAAAFIEPAAAADMVAEAGRATVRAGSPSAKGEADLGVELPAKWLKKPRSAGRRGPRQVTPPKEGSWWE